VIYSFNPKWKRRKNNCQY